MRFLIIGLLLSGCVVTENSYQRGDNSTRQDDMDACQISALGQAPRAIDANNIDRNFDLRMRIFDACMAEKGYKKG
jgi:hypothetical protein